MTSLRHMEDSIHELLIRLKNLPEPFTSMGHGPDRANPILDHSTTSPKELNTLGRPKSGPTHKSMDIEEVTKLTHSQINYRSIHILFCPKDFHLLNSSACPELFPDSINRCLEAFHLHRRLNFIKG